MADVGGESVTGFTLAKLQEVNLEDAGSLDKQLGSWSEEKGCRLEEQTREKRREKRGEGRGLVRAFLEAGAGGLSILLPGCHSTAGCRTDTKDEVSVSPH